MKLIDANILLYTADQSNALHKKAVEWWDAQLSSDEPVCLCWQVINAFIRIGTNPRVFEYPLNLSEALQRIQSWLDQPPVQIIHSTEQHWELYKKMLTQGQAIANLVPDAHLGTLAIENGCTLYSTDSDFSRFPKLKWKNPLNIN